MSTKKERLEMKTTTKVLAGVLTVVILCGVWITNAFAYNVITTAPTYTQHKAYRDARKSRTTQMEDGKYVYTLQINIAGDRWGMDRL
ncbi:hypothetical protein KAT51_06710, partial [bacterium]|nr:hypothetical protein [bacterium]